MKYDEIMRARRERAERFSRGDFAYDESKHPRDEDGRWTSSGSASVPDSTNKPVRPGGHVRTRSDTGLSENDKGRRVRITHVSPGSGLMRGLRVKKDGSVGKIEHIIAGHHVDVDD